MYEFSTQINCLRFGCFQSKTLDGKKLQKLVVLHAKCKSCTSTSNFFPTVDIAVCLLNDKTWALKLINTIYFPICGKMCFMMKYICNLMIFLSLWLNWQTLIERLNILPSARSAEGALASKEKMDIMFYQWSVFFVVPSTEYRLQAL